MIKQLKSLENGEKMPKNVPKWEHKLPKITNVEKPTKIGTKMPKNLPKWETKLSKIEAFLRRINYKS